ncbi:MAG: hypothetical protein FJ319_05345 [SAR202 cluster bacterium]|nr:hypothetical protein [SAR202 cluster bacterium]
MLRIGWMSTGRGEGSRGFLEYVQRHIAAGELDARVEFVFSNRERGEAEGSDQFFRMVEGFGIPLVTLSFERYRADRGGGFNKHRLPFHREVMAAIAGYEVDFIVLAGYMLFTGAEMPQKYPMLNLHPALPGYHAGTWQEVIWKLIEERARVHGVFAHVATEVLDAGPALAYCSFRITGPAFDHLWSEVSDRSVLELQVLGEEQPLFKAIRQAGLKRERPFLLECLRLISSEGITIREGHLVDRAGNEIEARDITEAVERRLALY